MVKFIAFFLTFFTFSLIMESPLERYIPNPVKEYFEVPEDMAYGYSYVITVGIPKEDFDWEEPYALQEISINEAHDIVSDLEGFDKISDYEYNYYIDDAEIYVVMDAFEPDLFTEGKIQYIDFHIYEEQANYIDDVYNISKIIADDLAGAKILDYQMQTYVTNDNADELKYFIKQYFDYY